MLIKTKTAQSVKRNTGRSGSNYQEVSSRYFAMFGYMFVDEIDFDLISFQRF